MTADFPFDVVAFDLDGTLADTAPDLTAALNHALGVMGRPPVPAEDVRHMVGHGARALLQKGLSATGEMTEDLVEQGFPIFIDYYLAHIADGTTIFPGLNAALDQLAARGVKLAVCTNKAEGLARRCIDELGWGGRFDALVGGDTLPVRKPDPSPLFEAIARAGGGRAAYVGDSITDTDTGPQCQYPDRRGQLRLLRSTGRATRRDRPDRSFRRSHPDAGAAGAGGKLAALQYLRLDEVRRPAEARARAV